MLSFVMNNAHAAADEDTMKIAHYIASCSACSRREAERCILEGLVMLNGVIHTNVATRITSHDRIDFNGKLLIKKQPKIWGYYKPIKVLTTHKADFDAHTVFQLVQERLGYVISVGRLDYMSEGLLLLTNSNEIAHEMMNGDYSRVYQVCIGGMMNHVFRNTSQSVSYNENLPMISRETLALLENDFVLDNIEYKAWKINKIVNNWIEIELYEGKNREIRKVLEALGVKVLKLVRIAYGPYKLTCKSDELIELQIHRDILDKLT